MNRATAGWKVGPGIMASAGVCAAVVGLAAVVQAVASAAGPIERSVEQRIDARGFPSIFQAWSPVQNVHDESPLHTVARHDLVWHGPEFFGLKWNNRYVGLADGFAENSIEHARAFRQKLLGLNPSAILILEIRYRDARKNYLPEGHSWWLRDTQGRIVPGWDEGGFVCLDYRNPEFRRQVAQQAKAAVASGAVDGIMLDWWSDDAGRLALVKEIRQCIGDEALIICNANARTTPQTAPYINGYFMECAAEQHARTLEKDRRYPGLGRKESPPAPGELRGNMVPRVERRPQPDAGDDDAGLDAFQWLLFVFRSQSIAHARPSPQLVSLLGTRTGPAGVEGTGGCRWHHAAGIRRRDGGLQPHGQPNCGGRVLATADQRGNRPNRERHQLASPDGDIYRMPLPPQQVQ